MHTTIFFVDKTTQLKLTSTAFGYIDRRKALEKLRSEQTAAVLKSNMFRMQAEIF